MNRKAFGIVGAIVIAIAAGFIYLVATKDTARTEMSAGQNQSQDTASRPQTSGADQATASKGVYSDYRSEAIASTAGTKLLFFHAPWCPQCRDLEADIKAKGVPANVAIFKVDYDSSQTLRQKYGVTLQTTVVKVNDRGELVDKFVAYDDPSLEAVSRRLL